MPMLLSEADEVMREILLPLAREQLNNSHITLAQLEKRSDMVVGEGDEIRISLHVGRSGAVGSRKERETIPTARSQRYKKVTVGLRYHVGVVELSEQALRQIGEGKSAVIDPYTSETDGIVNDLVYDRARQLFGTSDGVIAKCGSTSDSTTIVLDSGTTETQLRGIVVGMPIDIGTVSNPTAVAAEREVESVDVDNKKITIKGTGVTTTASHRIFRAGNGGSGSNQRELTGLRTIVDDTDALYGLDPSSEPVWAAVVNAGGGTPRTPTDAIWGIGMTRARINSGKDIDAICTDPYVYLKYGNAITTMKRANDTLELKGGFQGLSVAAGGKSVALYMDEWCTEGTAYGLRWDVFSLQQATNGPEWLDRDGTVLHRAPGRKLMWEAELILWEELACEQRNCLVRWDDLSRETGAGGGGGQ